MLGFILKKVISRLLFPLPLSLELLLAGMLVLWLSRRRRRLGLALVAGGMVVLLATGYAFPAGLVLRRIEWHYPPPAPGWTLRDLAPADTRRVWVAVLGSGINEDDTALPANSRFDARFLARVIEGVRLVREDSRAVLILSLPGRRLPAAGKQLVAEDLCRIFAVEPGRVRLLTTALDTADEAGLVADLAGAEPLALVTSASHMLRAMRLFQGAGLHPTACPTDFLTSRPGLSGQFEATSVYPSADRAYLSERTAYECLGLAWAALRGQTSCRPR